MNSLGHHLSRLAGQARNLARHAKAAYDWSSDGCTGVPDFDIRDCCEAHDFAYRNGTKSRAQADRDLRRCIASHGWLLLPWIYWLGVRLFGRAHYNWRARRAMQRSDGE